MSPAAGLYLAFFVAPEDYQQGHTVKIMFIHVPFAWIAMMGYMVIAVASVGSLIWRHPMADVAAKTAAPIGACFTFLALVTGSLWGKPMLASTVGNGAQRRAARAVQRAGASGERRRRLPQHRGLDEVDGCVKEGVGDGDEEH